jgi:hypothetical protein
VKIFGSIFSYRAFSSVLLTEYSWDDLIEEDQMDGTRRISERSENCIYSFSERPNGRDHLEDMKR